MSAKPVKVLRFVQRYRHHNDTVALRHMRERNSAEKSVAELNEQLRQWRLDIARRLDQ